MAETTASRGGRDRVRALYALSDSTGQTAELVAHAALVQFQGADVAIERVTNVRSLAAVETALRRAAAHGAIVLYTIVRPQIAEAVEELAAQLGVPAIDVLGPVLVRVSQSLGRRPAEEPGLLRHLDDAYFRRIDAIEFAVKHDDGSGLSTLAQADLVLIGVSRTSKTPTSIYLSYHGWRVANVPILADADPPDELLAVGHHRILCLTIERAVLQGIRRHRQLTLGAGAPGSYSEVGEIERELAHARALCLAHEWTSIDVTHKAVEEVAGEILHTMHRRGVVAPSLPAKAPDLAVELRTSPGGPARRSAVSRPS